LLALEELGTDVEGWFDGVAVVTDDLFVVFDGVGCVEAETQFAESGFGGG